MDELEDARRNKPTSRPPEEVEFEVDGRLPVSAAARDAPITGDDTRCVEPPNPLLSSPSSRAEISFICPGRIECFCNKRAMSPFDAGFIPTTAHIAASRTAGSRSSNALTVTFTTDLTVKLTSPDTISRSNSANARSITLNVSSRTRQFLCRHAGDSFPTNSSGDTTPDDIRAMNRSLPASRTGALASPSRSKTLGNI